MGKHTYLYPLPEEARFLWMLARQNPSDLFGYPDDDHAAGWLTATRLSEEFGRARDAVMRLIKDAPRVCIGFGYTIPNSVSGEPDYHDTHEVTRLITRRLWDGEVVNDRTRRYVMGTIRGRTVPDCDPCDAVEAFLNAHRYKMIIPVWM